jgi:hypothetical protein
MLCLWFTYAVTSPIAIVCGLAQAIGRRTASTEETAWNRYFH